MEGLGINGPDDFVSKLKGQQVRVKLNDGSNYVGKFVCMDGCLNVVLEDVITFPETIEGDDAIPSNQDEDNTFSECFIRGNNLCYITPLIGAEIK